MLFFTVMILTPLKSHLMAVFGLRISFFQQCSTINVYITNKLNQILGPQMLWLEETTSNFCIAFAEMTKVWKVSGFILYLCHKKLAAKL